MGKSFKQFLEDKKLEHESNPQEKMDWRARKYKWLNAVEYLYEVVDEIILSNFESAGYNTTSDKEEIRITEDYIGTYTINKYSINADDIEIIFNPIGAIIIGAYGRVDMMFAFENIKLVLTEGDKWKIVDGIGGARKLIDFNEENIFQIFRNTL